MSRVRDDEAIKVATDAASGVEATEDQRRVAVIVGARCYRRGQKTVEPTIARLERELHDQRERVAAVKRAAGFTAADIRYIDTIHTYGCSRSQIAKLYEVDEPVIGSVLESIARQEYSFTGRRARGGGRALQI